MKKIKIFEYAGDFAENKDVAKRIRIEQILVALEKNEQIELDFYAVSGATQSFVHAMISEIIRQKGPQVLDKIIFKNCNDTIKKVINIVVEYMQEA